MTNERANETDFTERELELIGLLSEHYPEHKLDAAIVEVHTLEGGESTTLRLTLDDTVSTDFKRSRIAGTEAIDALADEAAGELASPAVRIGP